MIKAIDECNFTAFEDMDWKFSPKTSTVTLRSKSYEVVTGGDTLVPLQGCKSHQTIVNSNSASKQKSSPAKAKTKAKANAGPKKKIIETAPKKRKISKNESAPVQTESSPHQKNDSVYYERELIKLQKERDSLYEENEILRLKLEEANRAVPDNEPDESEVKRLRQQLDFFMRRADRLAEENENLMSIIEK